MSETPSLEERQAEMRQRMKAPRKRKADTAPREYTIAPSTPLEGRSTTKLSRRVAKMMRSTKNGQGLYHLMATRDAGSVEQFVEYLAYCPPDDDGKIAEIIKLWKNRYNTDNLDDIMAKVDVTPTQVYQWASHGASLKSVQVARFKMAKAASEVIDTHVNEAKNTFGDDRGFKDRMLFAKASGILPERQGTKINLNQTNLNNAQARAEAGDTALPAFESGRREIADIVRADD